MDGFAVCREVRRCGSVPVLIISARVGKEDQLNGFRLGADDYIEKPVDLDLLAAKIGSLFPYTTLFRSAPSLREPTAHWPKRIFCIRAVSQLISRRVKYTEISFQ